MRRMKWRLELPNGFQVRIDTRLMPEPTAFWIDPGDIALTTTTSHTQVDAAHGASCMIAQAQKQGVGTLEFLGVDEVGSA